MSTNDVPGADPKNSDVLSMGCWAEHDDGSLIFVESTEGNNVVYCIFDRSTDPVVQYRSSMPGLNFKKQFSWKPSDGTSKEKWVWHDKTPFDWDRVMKMGVQDGVSFADASGYETAARRVGKSLNLLAKAYDADAHSDQHDQELVRANAIYNKIGDALAGLPAAIGASVADAIKRARSNKSKKK